MSKVHLSKNSMIGAAFACVILALAVYKIGYDEGVDRAERDNRAEAVRAVTH